MIRRLVVVAALVGCGDNEPCQGPDYVAEGPLSNPYGFDLPDDCVGIAELPGRWFVVDPTQHFAYEYPKFVGSCSKGFRRVGLTDPSATTWWDGTRIFVHQDDKQPEFNFEYAATFVACVRANGELAVVEASYQSFAGSVTSTMTTMTGTRFRPHDELASGIELVGELGTRPDGTQIAGLNLAVEDGIAYVAGLTGLDAIDVSDPTAPTHVGAIDEPLGYNDVKLFDAGGHRYAYAAPFDGRDTVVIDTAGLVAQSTLPYAHSLFVAGDSLYLANYTDAVPKYDLSNPVAPSLVGSATIAGPLAAVHDLFVDGSTVFVNYTTAGFVALDVSAGIAHPRELARTPAPYSHSSWVGVAGGRKVVMHGDEGMTLSSDGAAFVRILDGDPASPTFLQDLGRYQTRPEVGSHNFVMVGDRAYIAYYQDGVRVVDLSDPTHPREIAHYNTWNDETAYGGGFEGALGVRVVDGLIYVADSERGLVILRETQ